MRINKLFTLISVLISVYFFTSCAETSPRSKMLVGTWVPQKATPYITNTHSVAVTKGAKVSDTTNAKKQISEVKSTATITDTRQADKLEHLLGLAMRTKMKINADKTCEIQNRGKPVDAKWKLKKKGTILFVKESESGQKRMLELVLLNDSSATIIQRTNNIGDIIVKYKKQ